MILLAIHLSYQVFPLLQTIYALIILLAIQVSCQAFPFSETVYPIIILLAIHASSQVFPVPFAVYPAMNLYATRLLEGNVNCQTTYSVMIIQAIRVL
jgi:hypothetical protein